MIHLIKNDKKINKIFLTFAILVILMILSLCLNTFLNGGDDYDFICLIKSKGILQNCIDNYYNWDGRFITTGAFLQAFCLSYLPIKCTILIWSICFLISGVLIYYIVNQEINLTRLSIQNRLILIVLLSIILWTGSFIHISETIYWGTGGVYSYDLFLGAIWTFLFLKIQKNKVNLISKISFVLFSLIVGASTQNLTIALITLTLITLLVDFLKKRNSKTLFNLLFLIALVCGILFISLAPGNINRIIEAKIAKPEGFILFYYIKNLFRTLLLYLVASSVLCFLTILFALATSVLLNPNGRTVFKMITFKLKCKNDMIDFLNFTRWFWVATSTVTAFLTIPEFVSKRTSIYFMFFIMIFTFSATLKIINKNTTITQNIKILKRNLFLKNLIIGVLLSSFFILVSYIFYKSYHLKQAVTERENILKNSTNKTVYLKLIDPKLSTCIIKFNDFKSNGVESTDWVFESQERYFKTKIVIVE